MSLPASQRVAGEKRSRSTSPAEHEKRAEEQSEDVAHADERIPFLTTLSMNHSSLFYGRRDIPGRFVQLSEVKTRAEDTSAACAHAAGCTIATPLSSCKDVVFIEAGGTPTAAREMGKEDDTPHASMNEDDTTILHSMLDDIMAAANAPALSSSAPAAETLPACAYLLRRYFHFPSGAFKPSQQDVCLSILGRHNTLAVCPTGWGKSLCYQFPMLVHRLLFECRYEQWCRQNGMASSLTNRNYATEEQEEGASAEPQRCATSLPAQLPPTLFSRFCIVVSPLLALMEDQAEKINAIDHLNAFVLSSKVDAAREAQLLHDLQSPLCPLDILFVSPEKFIAHVPLRRLLQSQTHRLAMLCIDEVHCVSGWAYDFRPTFMYVSRVLNSPLLEDGTMGASGASRTATQSATTHRYDSFGEATSAVPYLCLTATATAAVVRDVQDSFHIQHTIHCADQRRDNLELQAVDLVARHAAFHGSTSATACKAGSDAQVGGKGKAEEEKEAQEPLSRVVQDALLEAVRQLPKPMLVYVQSRAEADELSGLLAAKLSMGGAHAGTTGGHASRKAGVFHAARYAQADAADEDACCCASPSGGGLVIRCYHAALTRSMRTATQRQFLDGKVDVLVATVAFGMGIDKANIRSVVHASAPSSLEGYVQEIGRAGRDGERSVCRILYNPFDFYALRSRLWTALLSPAEMRSIVRAILSGPVTQVGQRLMLVSPSALSTELGFSEEAIETVLFLLITQAGGGESGMMAPFRAVLGSYPLKYKVLNVNGEAETASGAPPAGHATSFTPATRRRRTASSAAATASAGIGLLLRQLGATDAVLELCRVLPNMPNQIEMANRLSLPLAELQQRMQDLILGGTIATAHYGVPSALLLEVGDAFADAASPAGQAALVEHLVRLHRGRLDAQVRGLRVMFRLLASPSHDAIASALRGESLSVQLESPTSRGAAVQLWSPPGRSCGRLRAVSIANAFVEENRLRIHSSYEALRALMGVRPKSLIQHGKYAGQLPLEQSWYVNSPYFGALRTFELAWVLQILAPHRLDTPLAER